MKNLMNSIDKINTVAGLEDATPLALIRLNKKPLYAQWVGLF